MLESEPGKTKIDLPNFRDDEVSIFINWMAVKIVTRSGANGVTTLKYETLGNLYRLGCLLRCSDFCNEVARILVTRESLKDTLQRADFEKFLKAAIDPVLNDGNLTLRQIAVTKVARTTDTTKVFWDTEYAKSLTQIAPDFLMEVILEFQEYGNHIHITPTERFFVGAELTEPKGGGNCDDDNENA